MWVLLETSVLSQTMSRLLLWQVRDLQIIAIYGILIMFHKFVISHDKMKLVYGISDFEHEDHLKGSRKKCHLWSSIFTPYHRNYLWWLQTYTPHKQSFHSGSTCILELFHLDPMGPMQSEGLGGKQYVLIVIDDFSRYTWVHFLREKSNAFTTFRAICFQLQYEKDMNMKRIKSYHGREFKNS